MIDELLTHKLRIETENLARGELSKRTDYVLLLDDLVTGLQKAVAVGIHFGESIVHFEAERAIEHWSHSIDKVGCPTHELRRAKLFRFIELAIFYGLSALFNERV